MHFLPQLEAEICFLVEKEQGINNVCSRLLTQLWLL